MTRRKIRVLQIVNNLNYGGMERIVAELVQRLDKEVFDAHVLALGYMGHFGEGLAPFVTLHVARPMLRWSMLHPRSLADQIRSIAPDVVHLHSGVLYKGSLAASMAGVPYQVYTDHGRQNPDPWLNRWIDRRASRRVDAVVAVSDRLGQDLAAFISKPSPIRVVQNGVDTEHYAPQNDNGEFRAELGIGSTEPIIGSIGRLEPVKGYSTMIAAFAELISQWTSNPAPVLVMVGDGSERVALERLASELGVAHSVRFVGWRSDIERISRAFTVFSMSSHSEGTSVSLLEAMSAGLCPVVTDVGGNSAVLGRELAHRLVAPNDPGALALALTSALANAADREDDARRARARVLDRFSLEAMVRKYEAIYSDVERATPR